MRKEKKFRMAEEFSRFVRMVKKLGWCDGKIRKKNGYFEITLFDGFVLSTCPYSKFRFVGAEETVKRLQRFSSAYKRG